MARDGLFFRGVAHVSARSRAPVVAIAVQGVWASVIALSGKYDQILNYVVALDAVFFGLTGAALLVLRRRDPRPAAGFRMPGHPWTTVLFVAAFWALAVNTVVRNPRSAGIGVFILLAGIPAYLFWSGRRRRA
jgi:APA family basic amino acid/polyamine antiporter